MIVPIYTILHRMVGYIVDNQLSFIVAILLEVEKGKYRRLLSKLDLNNPVF